jgi:endonuclease III-like uncharacterized protein
MQLTPHFSLAELTTTNTKIDNTPSKEVIEVLRTTAFYMEKVREILGNVAITINSGYRSILAKSNLKFDQLIYEKTWVHISFDPRMRGNILTLKGKGKYVKGIV